MRDVKVPTRCAHVAQFPSLGGAHEVENRTICPRGSSAYLPRFEHDPQKACPSDPRLFPFNTNTVKPNIP